MKRILQFMFFTFLAMMVVPNLFAAKTSSANKTGKLAVGAIVIGFPQTQTQFCSKQQMRYIMTVSKGFTLKSLNGDSYGRNIHGVVTNLRYQTEDHYRTDQINVYGPKKKEAKVQIVFIPYMNDRVDSQGVASHCEANLQNLQWKSDGGRGAEEIPFNAIGYFFNLKSC